ncbi:MAG: hypothetical protein JSV31_16845 [Desulfobacterales bacterium]|nr:MAG: hypothetical protein JSV31_16845 [Desulfobacterales bacterium]
MNEIKKITEDQVAPLLAGDEDLELSGRVSKDTIDYLPHKMREIETASLLPMS